MVTSIARSSNVIIKEPKIVFEAFFARLQSVLVHIGVHLFDDELDVLGLLRVTEIEKLEYKWLNNLQSQANERIKES